VREALPRAVLALAAEQVGAAEGCFDLTMAYIAERVQFGRTIASFQAIKHRCAELFVRIGVARSMVIGTAALIDAGAAGEAAELEAAAAHAMASETLSAWPPRPSRCMAGSASPGNTTRTSSSSGRGQRAWFGASAAQYERIAARLIENGPLAVDATDVDDPSEVGCRLDGPRKSPARTRRCASAAAPGTAMRCPSLRKKWEQELASGGWTGIGWPKAVGGRQLSVADQVVFHEEYARAGGPGRMGHIGEG